MTSPGDARGARGDGGPACRGIDEIGVPGPAVDVEQPVVEDALVTSPTRRPDSHEPIRSGISSIRAAAFEGGGPARPRSW